MLEPSDKNENKYWKNDGSLCDDIGSYHAYQYNVTGGKQYFLSFSYGYDIAAVLWMKGDTVIKRENYTYENDTVNKNGLFVSPSNATSVRITGFRIYPICGLVEYKEEIKNNGLYELHPEFISNKFIQRDMFIGELHGRKYAKIEVKGGEKYLIQSVNYYEARAYIITNQYDEPLEYAEYSTDNHLSYVNKTVIIPNDGKYLYVNAYESGGIEGIDSKKIAIFCHIYKYGTKELTEKKISDLKWVAIGDSLTDYNTLVHNSCHMPNYVNFVSECLNLTTLNLGRSGTGYLTSGIYNTFADRIDEITEDTNLVTIFGSFNDLWESDYSLGTLNDTIDTRSVYGAIKKCIEKIYAINTDIRILLITPTPWVNANDGHNNCEKNQLTRDYVDAILNVGKWYGIPVLNLFDESGLHPWDVEYASKWFLNGDGCHPTSEIHSQIITPMLSLKIKQMFNM